MQLTEAVTLKWVCAVWLRHDVRHGCAMWDGLCVTQLTSLLLILMNGF